jgi:catechol 2,3-dioxygenase-like lactoylglutathione lyase family enzyme
MQVKGLDHVNIIAADLDETAGFYEAVLGLRPQKMDTVFPGFEGRWLFDVADRPIIHLMNYSAERHGEGERWAMPTGSIDHVALACEDFAGTVRRCEELGVAYRANDRKFGDLRQIFVTDPNNVSLELNFAGD